MENPAAACECTERHDKAERRNLMLITSAVLQWMLMIVCIVYLAVLYHQSHQAVSSDFTCGFIELQISLLTYTLHNKKIILVARKSVFIL